MGFVSFVVVGIGPGVFGMMLAFGIISVEVL